MLCCLGSLHCTLTLKQSLILKIASNPETWLQTFKYQNNFPRKSACCMLTLCTPSGVKDYNITMLGVDDPLDSCIDYKTTASPH